ncbi:HNH endonuclease signature motif containing protein [Streptomyces sp. NPDC058316]|uniref:HNH endonuclease signature motif containing protein n=1 Tax=Streptomyces sp. NPDC058316 TaxID=3346442 RepID=UPI0036E3DA4D
MPPRRPRGPHDSLLTLKSPLDGRTPGDRLRRELIRVGVPERCASCGTGTGWNTRPRCPPTTRRAAQDILQRLPAGAPRTKTALLRRALDETGVPQVCGECGLGGVWQGKRLALEVDHVNGDRLDNRAENLRYLCPSCHSQTPNFSSRSRRPRAAR